MYEVGWLLCKEPKFAFSYLLWYIHVHILPNLTLAKYKCVCVCVCLLPTMVNIASIELTERRNKNSVNLTL